MTILTTPFAVGAPASAPAPSDDSTRVGTLSFEGSEFVEAFNSGDTQKLVLILSPTCGRCLRGAADVADLLHRHPEAKLQVLVLWSPVLGKDTKLKAVDASSYLDDPRVVQFWDLWRFGMTRYKKNLGYPEDQEAWDVFITYPAGTRWGEEPPPPGVWMQDHNLDVGQKFDKKALELALFGSGG